MEKRDLQKLEKHYQILKGLKKTFLGYPCDAEFDYSPLYKFLQFPINNVGDPFEASTYRLQTKEFEQEVLAFFAKLFHLRKYWGYVTNGGTEGNLYGVYLGRAAMGNVPVLYSTNTHYSVKKNVHILGMHSILVHSQDNGEMDYRDFEKKLGKHKKVVVVANIGSTMRGAVDNVDKIVEILEKKGVKFHLHADAAFYGMILPFADPSLRFDFRTKIGSIAVSGHKFLGSPIPSGVVLCRKELMQKVKNYIEYIDAHDTTLSGSRDAFTPLVIWYRIKTIGLQGFKRQVEYCIKLATYLEEELKEMGWKNVHRSYNTVWFSRPPEKVIQYWQLAAQDDMAHVLCLPHDTKHQIDEFLNSLRKRNK